MATVHVLRVFTDPGGAHGNPLGIVRHGAEVSEAERQRVAGGLGYPETVFVDDEEAGTVRVFSPRTELPFAGHPLVGTAWFLDSVGRTLPVLRPPVGEVPVWREGAAYWVRGEAGWLPDWEQVRLPSAAAVDALREPPDGHDFTQFWAWQDEATGVIRARVFAGRIGVHEDEACGSASMLLAHRLGRALTVHHGEGSVLRVRPGPDGTVEVGGEVVLEGVRTYR